MKKICITGGRVVLPDEIKNINIVAEKGIIKELSTGIPDDAEIYDAKGKLITPGFVETHSHGAGGADFCDCTKEAFETVIKTHLSHGTTLICPTLMSSKTEMILEVFNVYRDVKKGIYGKFIHKLHLEGPYLNPQMCGAQRPDIIRCPSKEEVDKIFSEGGDIIGRIGAAPEICGIDYLIENAKKNGIVMSVAHSSATAKETDEAVAKGFNHVTHLYSATTSIRKINQRICSGILEAAYLNDDMYVELIGDGRHISEEQMKLAIKIKSADRINLTSDSMRAAGQTGIEKSYLGEICEENAVIIEDGVAKLPDKSSYAGSIATGDIMFKNAVCNYGISVLEAVKMLSETPAKIINESRKGSISKGKDCDIVIWNDDFSVSDIFSMGELIKKREGRFL